MPVMIPMNSPIWLGLVAQVGDDAGGLLDAAGGAVDDHHGVVGAAFALVALGGGFDGVGGHVLDIAADAFDRLGSLADVGLRLADVLHRVLRAARHFLHGLRHLLDRLARFLGTGRQLLGGTGHAGRALHHVLDQLRQRHDQFVESQGDLGQLIVLVDEVLVADHALAHIAGRHLVHHHDHLAHLGGDAGDQPEGQHDRDEDCNAHRDEGQDVR